MTLCGYSVNLNAVPPAVGSGTWTPLQVGALVSNTSNAVTDALVPSQGVFGFVWEVSNSVLCPANRDTVYVQSYSYPTVSNAGPDIVTDYLMNPLNANAPVIGVGTWSVLSGQGNFDNINNPYTDFISKNDGSVFLVWTITNGVCPPSSDTMEIRINPLLIPQIITPNDDGNNDYFEIKALRFTPDVKLSVFNRWGSLVYEDMEYKNNFNGYNKQGEKLADDTYFYILEVNDKLYKGYFVLKTN
jgi:gliding motility-associated-like protein